MSEAKSTYDALLEIIEAREDGPLPSEVDELAGVLIGVSSMDQIQKLCKEGALPSYNQCAEYINVLEDFLHIQPFDTARVIPAVENAKAILQKSDEVFI